jgi:anti-sigma regulatory factor (Ser/Thr protein kinase)
MPSAAESPATAPDGSVAMTYHRAGDLAAVREFVRVRAVRLGLPEQRAELLTIAVSELATNTLQHTSGGGLVRVWAEPGLLICDVLDHGPMRAVPRAMPAADSPRGRGLAIVERLCDEVAISTGPDGTRVRLRLHL